MLWISSIPEDRKKERTIFSRRHGMDVYNHHHKNRDRSYSRDSVQYVSESSSSSTSGQNRGRADTGDSSLSSDTNVSNLSMGGPRRRSHRPRGCRGGRKNRKKKNKVPTEIVGPNSTSTTISSKSLRSPNPDMSPAPYHNQVDRNAPNSSSLSGHFYPVLATNYQRQASCPPQGAYPPPTSQQHRHVPSKLGNSVSVLNSTSAYCNNNNNNTAFMLDSHAGGNASYSRYPTNSQTVSVQRPIQSLEGILPPPPTIRNATGKNVTGPNPYALTKQQPSQPLLNGSVATTASLSPLGGLDTVENLDTNENHEYPATMDLLLNPLLGMEMKGANESSATGIGGQSLFAISPRSFLTGSQGNSFHP